MLHSTPSIPFMPNKEDDHTSVERSAFWCFKEKKNMPRFLADVQKFETIVSLWATWQHNMCCRLAIHFWSGIPYFLSTLKSSRRPVPPPEKKSHHLKFVACWQYIPVFLFNFKVSGVYKVLPSSIFCNYKKHKGSFAKKCEGVQDCLLLKSVYLSSNGG